MGGLQLLVAFVFPRVSWGVKLALSDLRLAEVVGEFSVSVSSGSFFVSVLLGETSVLKKLMMELLFSVVSTTCGSSFVVPGTSGSPGTE